MLACRHTRLALVAVFVCGLARPAFADGAMGVYEGLGRLIEFGLWLLALGVVVLCVRVVRPSWRRQPDKPTEKAESPELPEARAMNERSRSERN